MPQVATTVRFTQKELQDVVMEKAKAALPSGNLGSSQITFGFEDANGKREVYAEIVFNGTQR